MENEKIKRKVLVAGHICLDITPVFSGNKMLTVDSVLKPGELINVQAADVHTGGAVSNTGLALKRMGVDVSLKGKVGEDSFGKMVLTILEKEHAEKEMIADSGSSTSYSIVLAIPGIDRIFLHHPGANDSFSADDLDEKSLEGIDLFHLGYPPLMHALYANQGEELIQIFQKVYEKGILTSLDLAAVDPESEAGRQDWESILEKVLPYVDYFMPSIEELCFMIDREQYEELRKKNKEITENLSISRDIEPLARKAKALGAKNLIIKCGAAGLYYQMGNAEDLVRTEKKLGYSKKAGRDLCGFEKSYEPSKIRSATGAGDTTIAAFLASLLQGDSLEQCLQMATATGASCVETYDALSGILSLEEQKKRIESGLKKQELIRE